MSAGKKKRLTKSNLERLRQRIEDLQDEAFDLRKDRDFNNIEGFLNDAAYAVSEVIDTITRKAGRR